jgi:putative ABC transport system permease protein
MTPKTNRPDRTVLRLCQLLVRLLSVLVPSHRRGIWKEEWEAELEAWWSAESGRGASRGSLALGLISRASSAIPDAFFLAANEWVLDIVLLDLKHRLRALIKQPGFTVISVFTIALCIAANSVIFSAVNGILLRPLPYPGADRIVTVFNSYPEAQEDRAGNSIPDYFDRRERIDAFEEVGLYSVAGSIVGEGDDRRHAFSLFVTPSLLQVLGAQPEEGRLFLEEDGIPGNHRRVIVSHQLWQERLGGLPSVVGSELAIDGVLHTVVGVLPPAFTFPTWEAGIWLPMAFRPEDRAEDRRYSGGPEMLALLREGSGIDLAREQVAALNAATLEMAHPETRNVVENAGFHTVVRPFKDDLIQGIRAPLLVLWIGVLFVLLIGCVNVANLLLVRTASRARDFATRHAIGAGRVRIIREVVTEGLLLSFLGGGLGILLAQGSMGLLKNYAVYDIPRMSEVGLDGPAVGFTFLLIVMVGMVAGLLPAARLLRGDLGAGLLAGGRRTTPGRRALSLQGLMVSSQVAVTLVLMTGAGLMMATVRNLVAVDPGFEPENVLGAAISLPGERYSNQTSTVQFIDSALEEIRSLPTVMNAAVVGTLPFSGVESTAVVTPEGYVRESGEPVLISHLGFMSPGYLDVMEIPLQSGRDFGPSDRMGDLKVVLVDEWLAQRYWPEGDALGRRVALTAIPDDSTTWFTIIGVVGNVRQVELTDPGQTGAVYRPHSQVWAGFFRLAVKTRGEPLSKMKEVRGAVERVDPGITPFWVVSLQETLDEELIPRRTPMTLLMASAFIGLILATMGIYGVLAFSVTQRRREIGVRIALGGTAKGIIRVVGLEWARVVGLGLLAGMAGALALSRLMTSLLFQVAPGDPLVLLGALGALAGTALVGYVIPAWRAARVNPVEVLNAE